jgi:hypothetical protein
MALLLRIEMIQEALQCKKLTEISDNLSKWL